MNSHRKTLAWYLAKPKQTAPLLQTLQSPAHCHNFYLPLPTTATFPGAAPAEFPNGQVWRCQWITVRKNCHGTQIPAPPSPPFWGFGNDTELGGTAALPPTTSAHSSMHSDRFSLDILRCCDTAFSWGLPRADEISGSGWAKLARWGLFSLISSFCQNYTWSCFVIVVSKFHLCLSNSIW